ncbi:MAG: hypothetical protein KF896_03395 [Ignavibacteriae bacterium]|nr:hypothetical protein [Ignavibacteriota bacterium]
MSVIQVDLDLLKNLIKESVAEALKEERNLFYENVIPFVSDVEMQDIINTHGEKPDKSEYIDMTEWFTNAN